MLSVPAREVADLFAEDLCGVGHSFGNLNAEGAARFAGAAGNASGGVDRKRVVMLAEGSRDFVACGCKVEKLIDLRDVDMRGAGQAVVAIHTVAF